MLSDLSPLRSAAARSSPTSRCCIAVAQPCKRACRCAAPRATSGLRADRYVRARSQGPRCYRRTASRHRCARSPIRRPADDASASNPHTRFRFYQQLECRIADGERYWADGFEAGPARYARWFRYKAPQRDGDGRFDRLALPPLIDTMPTALHRAIGPSDYRFTAPSLDLTLYAVDDTTREWLLVAVTTRRARALSWAIAPDAEVWDDEGRFLSYGSQAMVPAGPTPWRSANRRRITPVSVVTIVTKDRSMRIRPTQLCFA